MKGIIYKIFTKDKTYYGKTTSSLKQRWWGHKSNFNAYQKGKSRNMTVYDLLKEDDVKIELLEEIEIENKCDIKLKEREAYYIRNFQCVNTTIPLRTPKEYKKDNKEKIIQYKKEYDKAYRENNKKMVSEYQKEYFKNNKEKLKQYNKEYFNNNKEKLLQYGKEKVICPCCLKSMNKNTFKYKHKKCYK